MEDPQAEASSQQPEPQPTMAIAIPHPPKVTKAPNTTPTRPSPSNPPPAKPIDYRITMPPALHTLSRCISDLVLSASLATKLISYIPHPRDKSRTTTIPPTKSKTNSRTSTLSLTSLSSLFASKSRGKKVAEGERKEQEDEIEFEEEFESKANSAADSRMKLLDVLTKFERGCLKGGVLVVEEFGKMFSGAVGEKMVAVSVSREFMLEVARCEGIRECIEYACCYHILQCETRMRENLISPLSHALANIIHPRYGDFLTEAETALQDATKAVDCWTRLLVGQIELANRSLGDIVSKEQKMKGEGCKQDGEEWGEDYAEFAVVKREAKKGFTAKIGVQAEA